MPLEGKRCEALLVRDLATDHGNLQEFPFSQITIRKRHSPEAASAGFPAQHTASAMNSPFEQKHIATVQL